MDSVGFDVAFKKPSWSRSLTLELSVSWLRLLLLPRGADLSSRWCLTLDATVSTSRLLG